MKIRFAVFLIPFFLFSCVETNKTSDNQEKLVFKNLFSAEMNDSVSCYRIPSIITASNGDIVVAIDERVSSCGDLKWNDDINIVTRRSSDNGKTWTAIETIVDYPVGESASDPSMILDEITGEIFLFFNYMNLKTEKNVFYQKVIRSNDNGLTWSEPIDITLQITKPSWKNHFKFITSGRGIQTNTGALMHTLVNLKEGLFVFKSDNHGKSWELIDTPIKPADESKIVELNDGSLMINSRVNGVGARYIHVSNDRGKTWTSRLDTTLTDPACNASITRYITDNGKINKVKLLFSNLNSKDKRENLTVRMSEDEGKTWSKGRTIYAGQAGYSSMTILKNGDIGLIFEKDNYSENVFTSFSLKWLTEGKDSIN